MGSENRISHIIPVMLTFFTMGFVDLVGIATNYVKQDFGLSDTAANSFSVMVFFWFLVFSVNEQDRTEKNCIVKYGHYVYWIVDSYLCL